MAWIDTLLYEATKDVWHRHSWKRDRNGNIYERKGAREGWIKMQNMRGSMRSDKYVATMVEEEEKKVTTWKLQL